MDLLSEVLKIVRLDGALFYNGEFSAPWSIRSPASSVVAPYVTAGARHLILYHLLTEGRAYIRLEDGPPVPLAAGDIVIFPHGDPHIMGNGGPIPPADIAGELARVFSQGLKLSRAGGGGEITRFVCGYLACDPHVSRALLGALPRLLRVEIGNDAAGKWLEDSIRFSVTETGESRAGGEAVRARLSEVLLVEALRRYISVLPAEATGWLAGARDAQIGAVLSMLHRDPARSWTLQNLARATGISRSVLAERFQQCVGDGPIAYLTRWRLQLAAQQLAVSSHGVARIAADVGYRSEAAFNRAFKREFGVPPARFRDRSKANDEKFAAAGERTNTLA
jgi:AraC-like DNA-binding protein